MIRIGEKKEVLRDSRADLFLISANNISIIRANYQTEQIVLNALRNPSYMPESVRVSDQLHHHFCFDHQLYAVLAVGTPLEKPLV